MLVDSVEANIKPILGNLLSVFYRRYSVFFCIVNTNVGIGVGMLQYPISVRFFGIDTDPRLGL